MKKSVLLVSVTCLAGLLFADTADKNGVVRRPRPSRPSGGLLERKSSVPSKQIGVVNGQGLVSEKILNGLIANVRVASNIPLVLGPGNSPAKIELVETDQYGALAIFPEDFRACVNVKALVADKPPQSILGERLVKELTRATFYIMGTGCTAFDITKPIGTLAELDKISVRTVSAETAMRIPARYRLGITPIRFATYRQACHEGWAPAPTNDVQTAIWDEIHAMPTSPMKIKPETKKVEK